MVFLQPPRAMKTTTYFCIVLIAFVVVSGGVWRRTSSRGGFFLLGAEAAELVIGWDGLVYTVDDDSTIQEPRDFDGVTKKIGPYYLSARAQHIKDEFTEPYDWDDYLQDFESYMDDFAKFLVAMIGLSLLATSSRHLLVATELLRIRS